MKVIGRIVAKLFVLALVIALCAGGAAAWRGYTQATPEFTINRYLSYIIDGNIDRAFPMLDETGGLRLSREAYEAASLGKGYGLYSGFSIEGEPSESETGIERDVTLKEDSASAVYTVRFTDAAGEVKLTEDIPVVKMENLKYGFFADWKIDPDHVMVHGFQITVPAGSSLVVGSEAAEGQWLAGGEDPSADVYEIPVILPQNINISARHPVLESANASVNPMDGAVDFTSRMPMKESAKSEAKELGVAVVKNLLTAAVKEDNTVLNIYLDDCKEQAETFVKAESAYLHGEGKNFLSIAASSFAEEFGAMEYDADGNVRLPMTFSYRYTIRSEQETESYLYFNDDGTPQITTETVTETGISTAEMVLTYLDGAWTLTRLDIPVTQSNS